MGAVPCGYGCVGPDRVSSHTHRLVVSCIHIFIHTTDLGEGGAEEAGDLLDERVRGQEGVVPGCDGLVFCVWLESGHTYHIHLHNAYNTHTYVYMMEYI